MTIKPRSKTSTSIVFSLLLTVTFLFPIAVTAFLNNTPKVSTVSPPPLKLAGSSKPLNFNYTDNNFVLTGKVSYDGNGNSLISCPTVTFCMVDSNSGLMEFNGSNWTSVTATPPDAPGYTDVGSPEEVSCPAANWCFVIFAYYTVVYDAIYNGNGWSTAINEQVNHNGPDLAYFLKCASVNFCMETNNYGNYDIYTNGSWEYTAPNIPSIPGATGQPYYSGQLQCTEGSSGPVCYTKVDQYVNGAYIPGLMKYSNSSWSTTEIDFPAVPNEAPYNDQGPFNGSPSASYFSCPTANFCMVQYLVDSPLSNGVNYAGFL